MPEKLNDYAVGETSGRGRKFAERPHKYRSDFERDRDRIVHCSAFRRLEGKTQVFTPGLDDSYRTRLTHSIEVAQIGRTIAKALRLNENLTEAICLAHDLGHPPFGHAGEKVLDDLMAEMGGFEHNTQTLRIVELLEHPYPDFAGLNLAYETRLGLAKHITRYDRPTSSDFGELNCSLEGQIADTADRIAYDCHDLEDGMRAGLIDRQMLEAIELFTDVQKQINAEAITDPAVRRTRTAKAAIDKLVSDCIAASTEAIAAAKITSVEDVYATKTNHIVLSDSSQRQLAQLEEFLLASFYKHESLMRTADKVRKWLRSLFDKLCRNPGLMPPSFQKLLETNHPQRTVCDYIAGMTDQFCLKMLAPLE